MLAKIDLGIQHAIFNMPMDAHKITPLEIFGKEIIPVVTEFLENAAAPLAMVINGDRKPLRVRSETTLDFCQVINHQCPVISPEEHSTDH